MHPEAEQAMRQALGKIDFPKPVEVLDVGAYNYNGTYRPMVNGFGWNYTGIDIQPGPNVDIVSDDPYHYPFEDNTFDVVMSGGTMEHVKAIWLWIPELVRVLKPGGALVIITHWQYHDHKAPVDCWRIMPDGMTYLFDETRQLERYDIRIVSQYDILGMGYKRVLPIDNGRDG